MPIQANIQIFMGRTQALDVDKTMLGNPVAKQGKNKN